MTQVIRDNDRKFPSDYLYRLFQQGRLEAERLNRLVSFTKYGRIIITAISLWKKKWSGAEKITDFELLSGCNV